MSESNIQTAFELELAELIVENLNIDWIAAAAIDPSAPLFGGDLGLDSIDALELALAVSRTYDIQLRADSEDNQEIFSNLRSLASHIEAQRAG